jgi:hypothetical protein
MLRSPNSLRCKFSGFYILIGQSHVRDVDPPTLAAGLWKALKHLRPPRNRYRPLGALFRDRGILPPHYLLLGEARLSLYE